MNNYLSIITLNVNGLNAPIKRNPKRPIARHIIIKNGKIPRQRVNLKVNKGETGSTILGSPNKATN